LIQINKDQTKNMSPFLNNWSYILCLEYSPKIQFTPHCINKIPKKEYSSLSIVFCFIHYCLIQPLIQEKKNAQIKSISKYNNPLIILVIFDNKPNILPILIFFPNIKKYKKNIFFFYTVKKIFIFYCLKKIIQFIVGLFVHFTIYSLNSWNPPCILSHR
jgi:hypothetical protein